VKRIKEEIKEVHNDEKKKKDEYYDRMVIMQ